MPAPRRTARLKARVRVTEAEYEFALSFLKASSETTGVGEKARWFATLAKFPEISERLVRAYKEYVAALEEEPEEGPTQSGKSL